MNRFVDEVAECIRNNQLLHRGQRVLVAVSGGLDSMVLLEVLSRLARRQENRWSLVVAHFNHQLRGRSSQADERLVRTRARTLGWPCKVGQGKVRTQAQALGLSIEMMARRLRHDFLAETARRLGISTLAFAHHADDQIELFWVRLFRGAGSEGLAGMRTQTTSPVAADVRLVRPFLDRWRIELERFAAQEKISFREDASNRDESILRNKIRHRLMPLLIREYQPGLRRVLQRQMDLLAAEAECLDQQAKRWSERRAHPAFEELPVALQRRLVASALMEQGIEPNFDLVELLRGHRGVPVMVAANQAVRRNEAGRIESVNRRELAFRQGEVALDLGAPGEFEWGGVHFRWCVQMQAPKRLRSQPGREWFDAERVGRLVGLRHWRVGDRFEPIGLGAAAKLQDLFTNRKIPASERRSNVLATAADGQIWWVQGLRIAEHFKVRSDTRRFLDWRWKPQRPSKSGATIG